MFLMPGVERKRALGSFMLQTRQVLKEPVTVTGRIQSGDREADLSQVKEKSCLAPLSGMPTLFLSLHLT